ncbi:Protein of unknown function (DUF1075) [Popillia japonica]|uniref:Uncharacterized protein n=1 Tax=Popillia japonica TaxID=7064 RepID=A0AAW1IZM7_POPJA
MANIVKLLLPQTGILTRNVTSVLCKNVRFESHNLKTNLHKVNNLEKRFLVWTKKYKTVEEVPNLVPAETVEKARNRMRIRIANIMMAATLVACILVSMSGKRARDRGESLLQQNLDWHKAVKEEAEKEKLKAEATS